MYFLVDKESGKYMSLVYNNPNRSKEMLYGVK